MNEGCPVVISNINLVWYEVHFWFYFRSYGYKYLFHLVDLGRGGVPFKFDDCSLSLVGCGGGGGGVEGGVGW